MNQFLITETKNLLKKYNLRPSQKLGQNFLVDEATIKKVIEAADLKKEDVILEIGPGLGILTKELAKKVKKVIAIEKDEKFIAILNEELKNFNNIEIIKTDVRKINISQLRLSNYKIVANLPFYLTSFFIRKILESENYPKELVLIIQKEVAQRICAKPPKMTILSTSVQFYAKPEIIYYISKNSFWPQPEVDAALIKITPYAKKRDSNTDLFFKIIKAGFSQPRKQLINNLSKGLKMERERVRGWLLENKIQPEVRAETLNIENWINLTEKYFKI